MREVRTFCRICSAHCGMVLTIEEETGRIASIKGDRENPMSNGYVCFKGLQAEEIHHGPRRLLRPLKRQADGSFVEIDSEQALDEISETLRKIIDRDGADAVATFKGTAGTLFAAHMIQLDFLRALGSTQFYSTNTLDQSAKLVSFERQGGWGAGVQDIDQSEVLLFFGCNPLLSHSTMPVMGPNPSRVLKGAKARGMKLICVDPRRTETAHHADLHLQPLPGRDGAIAAAMIRIVIDEGWEDKAFTARHVGVERVAALREAVEPFTTDFVESCAGLEPGLILAAAKMFACDCRSGAAFTSTGPSMAPASNLTQHLVDTLNIICGRFRRAGDKAIVDMLNPPASLHAEVIPPPRSWEAFPPSRIRGVGRLGYDRLASTLPEEILTPGEGQVRALIVHGGNPAMSMPDQVRAVEAFKSLELMVAIDPYRSATARLAHYVLPPTMMYERPDLPISVPGFSINTMIWAQYTPAALEVPPGSDLVEEWYPYWAMAKRLGIKLEFFGVDLQVERDQPPTTDELLAIRLAESCITLDELKADRILHPAGKIYSPPSAVIQPARPGSEGRFDVIPPDVAEELAQLRTSALLSTAAPRHGHSHFLITRRMNRVMNTVGMDLNATRLRDPYNPAYLNPDEAAALGLEAGDRVEIISDHGRIEAIAQPDNTLRPGVISISHGWGGLPEDEGPGVNVNLLIACDKDVEPINSMPHMSAVPVTVRKVG